MGCHATGILAYGYDLGGGSQEWKVAEITGDNQSTLDWFLVDEDADDFRDQAEACLVDRLGDFTDTDPAAQDYYQNYARALVDVGITVDTHGDDDDPSYVLAAHLSSASSTLPQELSLDRLEQRRTTEDWDGKLADALTALGLTPAQDRPRWLLLAASD
jgi:hypothetical protein